MQYKNLKEAVDAVFKVMEKLVTDDNGCEALAPPLDDLMQTIKRYELLEKAPVEWDEYVSMYAGSRQELARLMDGICERAARISGYLGARGADGCGDSGHAAGVRASNHLATKVRRAIGFTQAKSDIRF